MQNQDYKLHRNGLFYDIAKDREERNPIPLTELKNEQHELYRIFRKAIDSMPETNYAYKEK